MTIIYQYRVATTSLGGFLKLLNAWKGSVYKLLYKELIIFVTLYTFISLIYRLALTGDQRIGFEGLVLEINRVSSAIPLSFLLGFYVTFIAQRWWQQFTNVPWPDRTLFTMVAYLHGFDDRARMMRRSVARYMLFGLIWICRGISVSVMKRFPTLDHIVEAGFITKEEKAEFEKVECKYQKFFVPITWANQILVTARREGKIDTDFGLRMILQPLADFRDRCSLCFVYDWITVPLVYTQVVTFAVYSYFAISLFGQQYLDPAKKYKGFEQDFYVPGFSILQFLFYMGWLKVAEQMINPFGEDDDDFDINWLLDRHTTVAFTLIDKIYGKHPELVKDMFWNDVTLEVPYTESSARFIRPNFLGSTFNISPPSHDSEKLFLPELDEINQHEWSPRPRGKSSMSESLLSLFHVRSLRQHPTGDSQTTLNSNGSGHGRIISNGKAYYVVDKEDREEGRKRRSSFDIPLRERAHTDIDFRGRDAKERKLSLPFTINLFKNKQKRSEQLPTVGSPKNSRFTVEPVKEEDVPTSESSSATKPRRSIHTGGAAFPNIVSRTPMLSAIDEGSTVSSLKQLMDQTAASHSGYGETDEAFIESQESGVLSDDDRAYEDCISYTDERNHSQASHSMMNDAFADYSSRNNSFPADTLSSSASKKTKSAVMPKTDPADTIIQLPAIRETSQAMETVSRRGNATSKKTDTPLDNSQAQPLLATSQIKIDMKKLPKQGQTSSTEQAKTNQELAPLFCIEEC